MLALAIALVAGMPVGNGPERVSTQTEQRLCLDGEWDGIWEELYDDGRKMTAKMRFKNGSHIALGQFEEPWIWVNEGNGRCRIWAAPNMDEANAIYKRDANCITICMAFRDKPYPTAFRIDKGIAILTLRRTNSQK
jgi:hypothetical protein